MSVNDPEFVEFLQNTPEPRPAPMIEDNLTTQHKRQLTETDMSLIRAIEDVINILIDKNMIDRTELHPQLTELLEQRNRLRRLVREFADEQIDGD